MLFVLLLYFITCIIRIVNINLFVSLLISILSFFIIDLMTFEKRWNDIWVNFWLSLAFFGFGFEEFKEIWSKKYQVNKFRVDSNY